MILRVRSFLAWLFSPLLERKAQNKLGLKGSQTVTLCQTRSSPFHHVSLETWKRLKKNTLTKRWFDDSPCINFEQKTDELESMCQKIMLYPPQTLAQPPVYIFRSALCTLDPGRQNQCRKSAFGVLELSTEGKVQSLSHLHSMFWSKLAALMSSRLRTGGVSRSCVCQCQEEKSDHKADVHQIYIKCLHHLASILHDSWCHPLSGAQPFRHANQACFGNTANTAFSSMRTYDSM